MNQTRACLAVPGSAGTLWREPCVRGAQGQRGSAEPVKGEVLPRAKGTWEQLQVYGDPENRFVKVG